MPGQGESMFACQVDSLFSLSSGVHGIGLKLTPDLSVSVVDMFMDLAMLFYCEPGYFLTHSVMSWTLDQWCVFVMLPICIGFGDGESWILTPNGLN